jgi:hypothetical protein
MIKKFNDYVRENKVEDLEAPVKTELDQKMDQIESQFGEEDEEEYIGNKLMDELAQKLGTQVEDGQINYDGQLVNFFSETEMFHVDKKKFKTPDEVVDYLTGGGKGQFDV